MPTLLGEPDGIWSVSMRQAAIIGAGAYAAFTAWDRVPHDGPTLGHLITLGYPELGWMDGLFPIGAAAPAAILLTVWVLCLSFKPPPEHGLMAMLAWARGRLRNHGLRSPVDVAADLGNPEVQGNTISSDFGFHAVWEVPSVNLRLADAAEVEMNEDMFGQFLMGAAGPIQTMTLATKIDGEQLATTISLHPRPQAKKLAQWLRDQAFGRGLIERRQFVAVHGEDLSKFEDAVQEVVEGLNALGLRTELVRRLKDDELSAVVKRTFSSRKVGASGSLGPSGPWTVGARQVLSDGEWHEVTVLHKLPRVIDSNFLGPYIDGSSALDVITFYDPQDPDEYISKLERRFNAMKVSGKSMRRGLAIDDLESFTRSLASGEEQPFKVATYFHCHDANQQKVATESKRVMKRLRRVGARGADLRWEEAAALRTVAPLGIHDLDVRAHLVDTSTVKRMFPFTASAMWPEGSVPWGETLESNRPVGWTAWRRPLISNPQLFVAALSGGGKGFAVKVHESRALFAGITRQIFGFDQAEEDDDLGEYGLFAQYCGLEYRHIRSLRDIDAALKDLRVGAGVIWNIAQLSLADRPEVMVKAKAALFALAADHPARRKLIVDELWSWAKGAAQMGADEKIVAQSWGAIEDIIRLGRHLLLGGDWMTQRIKDSFTSPLLEVVQSQCASQMYGLMKPAEITDVADRLSWTPAEKKAIKKLQAGQFLLTAGPWKVTMRVTASPDEYRMANTDGKVAISDVRPVPELEPDGDIVDDESDVGDADDGSDLDWAEDDVLGEQQATEEEAA